MTTAAHPKASPQARARAWSIALYLALAGAVLLALARAPGLWPPRLSSGASSGTTPE